jgi:hypothetical protein
MRPWNRNPYDITSGARPPVISWTSNLSVGLVSHELSLDDAPTGSVAPETFAETTYRLACYRLIDALPATALREAVEALIEIYRFHESFGASSVGPRLPRATGPVPATFAGVRTREPFRMEDED